MLSVVVDVEFGPAGTASIGRRIKLALGSTALDATMKAVPTKQGIVCCDPKNVLAIGGIACEPSRKLWWFYFLNGKPGPKAAHLVTVAEGDVILWKYMSEADWRSQKGSRSVRMARP